MGPVKYGTVSAACCCVALILHQPRQARQCAAAVVLCLACKSAESLRSVCAELWRVVQQGGAKRMHVVLGLLHRLNCRLKQGAASLPTHLAWAAAPAVQVWARRPCTYGMGFCVMEWVGNSPCGVHAVGVRHDMVCGAAALYVACPATQGV